MILTEVTECHEQLILTVIHHKQHEGVVTILELVGFDYVSIACIEGLLVDMLREEVVLSLPKALLESLLIFLDREEFDFVNGVNETLGIIGFRPNLSKLAHQL